MTAPDEDDVPLAEERRVRIMCDYAADGVWDRQGRACGADDCRSRRT